MIDFVRLFIYLNYPGILEGCFFYEDEKETETLPKHGGFVKKPISGLRHHFFGF